MSPSLDYATLDTGNETVLNRLIQEQLGRGKPKRQPMDRTKLPPTPPALPMGELGAGPILAADLLAVAKKCGEDRKCWQSELLAMRSKPP